MTFLRKRIVQLCVLPALIVVGGLLGQRLVASVGPGPWIGKSTGARQVQHSQAEPSQPVGPVSDFPSELTMEIGPVAGLTSQWYEAPSQTSIPLGSTVEFQVAIGPGVPITWTGATESSRTEEASVASCHFAEVGQSTVMAHIPGTRTSVASSFSVLDIDPGEIIVESIEVTVDPFEIDLNLPEEELNEQTMDYFFGESIATLRDLGAGQYRTSVRRTLHMSTMVTPAGFEPLVEWRVDGVAQELGLETSKKFFDVAVHDISVGPMESAQTVNVETYNVWITSHVNGEDIIHEGEPVTFTAQTVPVGYESDITWLSSTKFGTGTPVIGQGPTFTVLFEDTWGTDNSGQAFQWLGVKPDNAQFGQDQKPGCCAEGIDPFGTNMVIPSSITFGSPEVPQIPLGFFGEGSDPVTDTTVELVGFPRAQLNLGGELEQCGTADTFVRRLGPVVCPGADFPRPCDPVPIEMVSLSLMGTSSITVTFNGGQDPETWLVALGARQPQLQGVLNAILEDPNGGTYTATLPVEVTVALVKESAALNPGPNDILELTRTVDMGLPNPVPWSRIAPADGGFFCEPQGFDLNNGFFPGEGGAPPLNPPEGCAICTQCSGAGCHGGPGHAHCICRPIPCPTRCRYDLALKLPFPFCFGPNSAPLTAKSMFPCDQGLPAAVCCGSPPLPPIAIGLFPCGFGLSLGIYTNPVVCDP